MKTSLHFEAPSDLSVGTVRITGEGDTIANWVATPGNRTFRGDDLKPGIYSAEIGPAGVPPQSVVFEVLEGQDTSVVLPSFFALASSGSNTSFFNTSSQRTASEVPLPGQQAEASSELPSKARSATVLDLEGSRPVDISGETRRIALGLSEEKLGRETFGTFRGRVRMELVAGQLVLEVPSNPRRDRWAGHRVRMSVAIEGVRIERCLLPLYRGGTRIAVAAPPFAPSDLEFGVLPIKPELRALVRALEAGTAAEVTAVRDDVIGKHVPSEGVLGKDDPAALLGDEADPWAAILAGLLAIRFPEIFGPIDPAWADALVRRAGWAFDTHVIRAARALAAAGDSRPAAQDEAVAGAVVSLAKAQVSGSPYYRYTNQLFGEISAGIAEYLKTSKPRIQVASAKRFDRLYGRWRRELPLQRGSGSTFTWLSRDKAALKEREVLVPNREPTGRLRGRDTAIIFEGQVSAGQIAVIGGARSSFRSVQDALAAPGSVKARAKHAEGRIEKGHGLFGMPALARTPGPDDDPNEGRFGGRSSRDGFHLGAAFEPTKYRNWVTVVLLVEADRSAGIELGDVAWFVLHPTFSPPTLKVMFRGNRARLSIQAWGGFTVGVWLPRSGVELECNLARIDGAPRIIHTR